MRWRETVRAFGGSVVVYLVMAACSASDNSGSTHDGGVGGTVADGAPGGSVLDALTNPVPDAHAEPTPPDIAVESCSKTFQVQTTTFTYAEHLYPGVPANELAASVVTVAKYVNPAASLPSGYDSSFTASAWVRDGAVAFFCGASPTPAYSSITFIRRLP